MSTLPNGAQTGLNSVLTALDAAASPVTFFLRDDDAGWNDARLMALLECTTKHSVPIDLAVIPQATGTALASALRAHLDAAPTLIGLHQHGYAHVNHESMGRKCEFGPARDLPAQRKDLIAGRERLEQHFGMRLDAIFTPPWNRCAPATPMLLAELGYAALSRDGTAPLQQALPELPVHVDWCKQRRAGLEQGETGGHAIAIDLAQRIAGRAVLGVMLHHAQMDDGDLALLAAWLPQWACHPRAHWVQMRQLATATAPVG
ncbi:MAG: hypothetical protein OEM00_01850 [Burkholderiaceae bacterium]|nr:hypothetical protein [Burkholderiaceae bacterium]